MNKYDDIFSLNEKERIEAAKAAAAPDPQADHGSELVEPPKCDCCPPAADGCVHETTIVCEFCNQAYPPNSEHACNKCGEPEGPQNETQKLISHYRALRRAATKAVKEYGDHGDGNTFGDLMIDLARELAEGAK